MHGRAVAGLEFIAGGGETGALMRALDWNTSPLGSPEGWSQSLRAVVSLLLTSKFPMFLAWGPDLGFVYNDSYAAILGTKHPLAMGRPFEDVWSEIWPDISPLVHKALLGEASFHEDLPLTTSRKGYEEQTYFTFSYSPVRDENGIGGLFCAWRETTLEVQARTALRQEKDRLSDLFRQAPGFMAVLRGSEHIFELTNEAYDQLVGRRELIGKSVREALPELAGQGFFDLLDRVYTTGMPFVRRAMPVEVDRKSAGLFRERFVDFVYQPTTDPQGRVSGIFVEGNDVTDRVRAESALRESEARFRHMADSAPALIWMTDEHGRMTFANMHFGHVFGEKAAGLPGDGWREVIWAPDLSSFRRSFRAALASRSAFKTEVRVHAKDGGVRWFRCEGVPRLDDAHQFLGYTGCAVDITDTKRAQEHKDLLINELNHRVKNTLATVQSIASQTLRNAPTPDQARAGLEARLIALSKAHDVLTRENWEGADLQDIVAQAVEPYRNSGPERIRVSGQPARVPPRTALALAMALQELATNAVKYGALSNDTGRIVIAWTVRDGDPPQLDLRWEEEGGPPVERPSRRGFGTRLIERSLAQDLDGEVHIEFARAGLKCTVAAPLLQR